MSKRLERADKRVVVDDELLSDPVLGAWRQDDGAYGFPDEDHWEFREDEIDLNHARSNILGSEFRRGLRHIDDANAIAIDKTLGFGVLPDALVESLRMVGSGAAVLDKVYPIINEAGDDIAFLGLDRTPPYDIIIEPTASYPIGVETSIYCAEFVEIPDSFGRILEAQKYRATNLSEQIDGRLKVEPHVFYRGMIVGSLDFLPVVCVGFKSPVETGLTEAPITDYVCGDEPEPLLRRLSARQPSASK